MKIKIIKSPYSCMFGYCSLPKRFNDLGDLVIFIMGYEIKIWWRK